MEEFTDVTYETDEGLAWITINRPERYNAFRARTVDELVMAFKRAWASDDVGVVALTGAGDKAFCAGGDQKQRMETGDYGPSQSGLFEVDALHRVIRDTPKPVIAAVNGPAIAGGMALATIPDFTLAVPEAKFGYNEVRVGFVPALAASFLLRQVGEKRTRELLLTGRLMRAHEAMQLGLVTQLVAGDELQQSAKALAQTLLMNSPQAMQAIKRLIAKHARQRLDAEIEDAIAVNALQRSTEDFREGVEALQQRRRANWPSLHPVAPVGQTR